MARSIYSHLWLLWSFLCQRIVTSSPSMAWITCWLLLRPLVTFPLGPVLAHSLSLQRELSVSHYATSSTSCYCRWPQCISCYCSPATCTVLLSYVICFSLRYSKHLSLLTLASSVSWPAVTVHLLPLTAHLWVLIVTLSLPSSYIFLLCYILHYSTTLGFIADSTRAGSTLWLGWIFHLNVCYEVSL